MPQGQSDAGASANHMLKSYVSCNATTRPGRKMCTMLVNMDMLLKIPRTKLQYFSVHLNQSLWMSKVLSTWANGLSKRLVRNFTSDFQQLCIITDFFKESYTVKCRYNAVWFITILHTTLWWQWQKVNQILESQQTPHISPSRASCGVPIVRILEKIAFLRHRTVPYTISEFTPWKAVLVTRSDIQMSHQYVNSYLGDKTKLRSSCFHKKISNMMIIFNWIFYCGQT